MDSSRSSRRRFLKQTAALAGVATSAGLAVRGQSAQAQHLHGELPRRGARYTIDHMTHYTPLQDYAGIITPAPLHFMQQHSSEFPEIDVQQHRVTIHGLVDRPLSFTVEELKRLPSVSRIHFLECHGNSSPATHGAGNPNMGLPVQFNHGMTSCSEWSGVLLSVLLKEAGLQKEASWLVSEGGDAGKFTHTLPLTKAMEDVIVAFGQNGEPLRVEQGYPVRLVVPGWEAPFSVKYLTHVKVVDQPYMAWNESMNHSVTRPDLRDKARWYHFQFGPKSVITRPSAGIEMVRGYTQITGLAWSGAGVINKVEVSTDGGGSWKEAKRHAPVLPRAHTRFTFDWAWDGQEAVIQSRCTDESGEVQPSLAELTKTWGMHLEDWKKTPRPRAIHFNAIQPWKIARDGSISDVMFA